MKGKIDNQGYLVIERAGVMRWQYCPFQKGIFCSDTCPHFQEPILDKEGNTHLFLGCGDTTLVFSEFTDERG